MSTNTTAAEFLASVEQGTVPVTCHEDLLRIAFIYLCDSKMGVFSVVESLHKHGWSFGDGELHFNRTLDIFYPTQLMTAIYRSTSQLEDGFPQFSDFPKLYKTHYALLHSSAWCSYYSTQFLTKRSTACFYRPPNLQDLPDASSPLYQPHRNPVSTNIMRLPRWAHTVAYVYHMQSSLSFATLSLIALRTLEPIMIRLHTLYPSVPPYSESHARFWLDYFAPNQSQDISRKSLGPNHFGLWIAQGMYDIHRLEAKYLTQVSGGEFDEGHRLLLEQVTWCGWPDGGISGEAWERGWQEEIGSDEEVEFLAAAAVEETAGLGIEGFDMDELDLSIRSHVLLAVMQGAVKDGHEREYFLEKLETLMIQKGTSCKERAGRWIREALGIMEPYLYVWQGVWPVLEERSQMVQQILVENPQLFACWRMSPLSKRFTFELGSRELALGNTLG